MTPAPEADVATAVNGVVTAGLWPRPIFPVRLTALAREARLAVAPAPAAWRCLGRGRGRGSRARPGPSSKAAAGPGACGASLRLSVRLADKRGRLGLLVAPFC